MNDYDRIEKAIHYINEHAEEQPSLDELAEYIGLSPYHFQKLFKRWAGVSPKRYLQYITAEAAKDFEEFCFCAGHHFRSWSQQPFQAA